MPGASFNQKHPSAEQPIQPDLIREMNAFAAVLDEAINGNELPKRNGFALLVFPFGQPNDARRANYVSNCNREDMLAAMKEFIARNEGRFQEAPAGGIA